MKGRDTNVPEFYLREVRIARYYDALRVLPFIAGAVLLTPIIEWFHTTLLGAGATWRFAGVFVLWGGFILTQALVNFGLRKRLAERKL